MTNEPTYAAVISISLPGMNDVTTAHIVLTAPEMVEVPGHHVKPLSECTLTDIRAFAESIEQDVWDTYCSIRLKDLTEDAAVQLDVTVTDKKGQQVSLSNWAQQTVLLPERDDEEESAPDQSVAVPDVEESEVALGSADEDLPTEVAVEIDVGAESDGAQIPAGPQEAFAEATILDEELPPLVTVSESEPVFAEREAEDDPNAFPTPSIAPSQARVRIAGRRLPPGDQTWSAVDILIDEPAMRAAQAHALSSPDREVAGVLLGPRPEKQPDGRYVVHVIDTVIAKYTVMHGASVTYTPESWRYMNDKLAERYPDETTVIVGWYHTHPGFGIFLSGMDQFIHQNFFTQIWHTALVLDPVARRSGFFCWNRERNRVAKYDFSWPKWAMASW